MITDLDRSGWFGASDTKRVMAKNHNSKGWIDFWEEKLGNKKSESFGSIYTYAGNLYEHPIIETVDKDIYTDGQILIEDLLLRVNYDGWKNGIIYEIKTHQIEKPWTKGVPKDYWMQCQVEMYAYQTMHKRWFLPKFEKLIIVEYPLTHDDYEAARRDETEEIEPNRINYYEIKYDKDWIKGEYLPNLKILSRALKKGKYPG